MRPFPLAVTAACVTAVAVAVLAGCKSTTDAPGTTSASRPDSVPPTAPCNADYCDPLDWATAQTSTPLTQIPPFAEPLNVVISARSTVPLSDIEQALGKWTTVSTATPVNLAGIHLKCISSEKADVTAGGYVPQRFAWRLGGCVDGNEMSLSGDEDHARIWNQPVAGSKYGAWFIAASYETMCLVRDGRLQPASANKVYAALHPGSVYHCVDGGPGSFHTAHPDGYDDAATDMSAAIVTAAKSHGWRASERTVTVKRHASSGEGGVPFNDTVYVLTVTT